MKIFMWIVWSLILVSTLGCLISLSGDLDRATSAPQQCAAAAITAAVVISLYVIGRALEKMCKRDTPVPVIPKADQEEIDG